MLGWGKSETDGVFATAKSARSEDIYQRYAAGLYRQAFVTLGDSALAERVVRDVIADECALAPAPGGGDDGARYRLAESVFHRCQELAAGPAWRDRRPAQLRSGPGADCIDPGGLLSQTERGALGLVLIGGLDYVRASKVLGINPLDMAALLRAVLLRLATSPATIAEDGGPIRGPAAGGQ